MDLRADIHLGRPRTDDDALLLEAAQAAGADSGVAKVPYGFDTRDASSNWGGTDLSDGQCQRIAVARAFYREAAILMLDEPTSAMDPRAEHLMIRRFKELPRPRPPCSPRTTWRTPASRIASSSTTAAASPSPTPSPQWGGAPQLILARAAGMVRAPGRQTPRRRNRLVRAGGTGAVTAPGGSILPTTPRDLKGGPVGDHPGEKTSSSSSNHSAAWCMTSMANSFRPSLSSSAFTAFAESRSPLSRASSAALPRSPGPRRAARRAPHQLRRQQMPHPLVRLPPGLRPRSRHPLQPPGRTTRADAKCSQASRNSRQAPLQS
ncbi:ATP-binding cassette domain-containing protein [Streptomyces melanogenes]|uniref:ATP-binding cassette domain-containing protein n=1 Tax=Streptomyces melanogenes TaxID=67326 RepID=A0ABZ1XCW3_9ACTN|nr:ATP-binding cassette domain-containing protein [Streptomyces melanogenes]